MPEPSAYTCREAFSKLDDFLDRALTADEMRRVREHLELCAVCASEFAFEESLLQHLREKVRRIDLPEDLLARVEAALDDPKPR